MKKRFTNYLIPVNKKNLLFNKDYFKYYCNFETIILNNKHYITCYSICGNNSLIKIVETIKIKNIHELIHESNILLNTFIQNCFSINKVKSKKTIFFFHNLNKFDLYFILNFLLKDYKYSYKLISRNNVFYKVKIFYGTQYIEFRDTLLYLPLKLDVISKTFLNTKKYTLNYNSKSENYLDSKFLINLSQYCLNDSLILENSFNIFLNNIEKEFKINPLACLSLPGLSMQIFRNYYLENSVIEKLSLNKDNFIRKSYRGGIIEVFKPHLINGFYYDINSLYPFVMKNYQMPIGVGNWIKGCNINFEEFFGFINVEVTSPQYLHKPFLSTYNAKNGLISPLGKWIDTYFSEEIKYAIKLGYKFKFINGIKYEKKFLFTEFVDTLYNYRLTYPKIHPLNLITKLLLNSLYGRFGMKQNSIKTVIVNEKELYNFIKFYNVKDYNKIHDKYIVTYENTICESKLDFLLKNNLITYIEYNELLKQIICISENSAVQIAASITAYARIYMHQFISDEKLDVYYTDTDSIFCKNKLPDIMVSDTTLGLFKLESTISEAFFIAPKLYFFKNINNEIKIISKGLPVNFLTEKNFKELFNNIIIEKETINIFKKDSENFLILKNYKTIHVLGKLLKRNKLFEKNIWIDTNPLII